MRLGISALLFNLDKALKLCKEVDRINHNHMKETIYILDRIKKGYDIPLFTILEEGSTYYG